MTAQKINRNVIAIASDIAEGFVTVNPIFLKSLDPAAIKSLYELIERKQNAIRAEPFPFHDIAMIRARNMRLQRLFNALIVIRNYAREKNKRL